MKKYLFLLFAMLLSCQVRLFAVPARPLPVTVTQSDGTTLVVRLCGDEFFHWYETSDGIPLVQAGSGDYCYAVPAPAGFVSSGVVAHEKARRTAAELRHAATARRAGSCNAFVGRRRGLVIMAEFPDRRFLSDDSHDKWNAILNEKGYSENGAMGCVGDYFRDQSNGLFDIRPPGPGHGVARAELLWGERPLNGWF